MRAVVQRVSRASVVVEGKTVGEIGDGLLVLLGVAPEDDDETARAMAAKIVKLRIFGDDTGKMNRSVLDVGGGILAVSQFTLLADTRKGNRPSFVGAAAPEQAEELYKAFCLAAAESGVTTEQGVFGAHMDVHLTNDGPVTIILSL
jgi:D-tyrosyl-tRNA(Tyr) deacylase